jgi:hypothetical protein
VASGVTFAHENESIWSISISAGKWERPRTSFPRRLLTCQEVPLFGGPGAVRPRCHWGGSGMPQDALETGAGAFWASGVPARFWAVGGWMAVGRWFGCQLLPGETPFP